MAEAAPEDFADVVDLQVHPFEPFRKPIPRFRRRCKTPGDVVFGATEFGNFFLTGLTQPEASILAHCFVQSIPRAALDVLLYDQRFVHER